MNFKKKLIILSALVTVLAITYALILFLDSPRRRDPAFSWLDSSLHNMADRIELLGGQGLIVLNRINGIWHLTENNVNFPVRQGRIEDLMSALSRRDTYPIRANTAQGAERLGFTEPSRIRVSGGVGLPLLDLLIGSGDALGREVYLKLSDRNEIHSGEDRFTMFTEARANFWLDFRLFTPASIADVQQVEVNISDSESYALRRSGNGWVIIGNETITLDGPAVDAWVRNLLEAEGENFATDPPEAAEIGIILRFGDGRTGTLYIGPADENNRRQAITSDSQFYFILSEWTVARLIRESSSFYR